jgi:hypothetical protein
MPGLSYSIGDVFGVPLVGGGFGTVVVARANRGGILLGYFFGPSRTTLPAESDIAELDPRDAVLVRKFGHLGLRWEMAEDWAHPRLGSVALVDAHFCSVRATDRPLVPGLL